MKKLAFIFLLALTVFSGTNWTGEAQAQTIDTLVPAGADWSYLDNGSDQGTAWRETSFDDSSWSSGPAELGYGDGDEATVVSYGPDSSDKYRTTYFRHAFNVTDPTSYESLTLYVVRDDIL